MKRIISIIASLALMIGLSPAYAGTVIFAAEGDIAVNETNFPDENFRNWITANIKGASDGILTSTEISNVTSIIAEGKDIGNLQGIEYFTNLTSLSCSQNQLTALDVSKLTKLTILDCSINNLSSLTLGANTVLEELYIFDNLLTSLDLGTRTLSGISVYQRIPALNITGESGAWKYDMSVLNIKDLSKVKIDDGQSAALDRTAGIVTFATADKPSKLSYTYDTGASIGDNSILLNVNVTEKVKNLDFVLTRNASNKYTVSVDNVPAGKQLLLIVPVAENGKTDAQIYDKYLQYYTKIMNGTDNIGHSAVGRYWLSSDDFTIKEITNNKTFDVDADLENQFIRGIGICITDPQEDSLYKLYQAGMTKGPIDIGSSSGNKINATAHNIIVTGGKASPSTAYKGDAVAITASNADTFDHWTSSADGVVFKDAKQRYYYIHNAG
jgi:hypothetical protein